MATEPSVWVVVLNWNGLADTLVCLASLRRLRYTGTRVVVVDNGSTDGSVAAIRRDPANDGVEIVEANSNLGYAGGNNLGIRHALDRGADFVLVLNNDTTVDPMLLDELLAAANRQPDAGCFGPWIYYMHDQERLWFTRSDWDPAKSAFTAPGKGCLASELSSAPAATDYVCGAALFFRAAVVRQIGLLDERFFLVYEDNDWCFRARRAGFAMRQRRVRPRLAQGRHLVRYRSVSAAHLLQHAQQAPLGREECLASGVVEYPARGASPHLSGAYS